MLISVGALSLKKVPKRLAIIGAGYIGLEMGSVWSRLGSNVEVIEYLDHITPGMDREISESFLKILKKQGIIFNLSTKVISVKKVGNKAVIETTTKDGKNKTQTKIDINYIYNKFRKTCLNLETILLYKKPSNKKIGCKTIKFRLPIFISFSRLDIIFDSLPNKK